MLTTRCYFVKRGRHHLSVLSSRVIVAFNDKNNKMITIGIITVGIITVDVAAKRVQNVTSKRRLLEFFRGSIIEAVVRFVVRTFTGKSATVILWRCKYETAEKRNAPLTVIPTRFIFFPGRIH